MAKNNACIPDIQTIVQAGIDPKTGLPIKLAPIDCRLEEDIKKQLRVLDEQNAVNRYKWYNLPSGLNGQKIERILYYRGQAMFFYSNIDEKFYFLPYALNGEINIYGEFTRVIGLPFAGPAKTEKEEGIEAFTRDVILDIDHEITEDEMYNGCVLLHDYTKQLSQTIISRQILQDPILGAMAEAIPFARTSLIANSGVKGMRVNDQDQANNVQLASQSVTNASKTGSPWIPIVGNIEFQDLTSAGSALKSEEYLIYLQALDNYRLSLYGLKNGGLFQKKSHMLESEQEMNDGNTGLVYQDGLTIRQNFCDFVNAVWGLGIWCEASETAVGRDDNMDGMIQDEDDQSGIPGEQPQMAGGEDE